MKECPRCEGRVIEEDGMFVYPGEIRPGYVCHECSLMWPVPGKEITPYKPGPSHIDECIRRALERGPVMLRMN